MKNFTKLIQFKFSFINKLNQAFKFLCQDFFIIKKKILFFIIFLFQIISCSNEDIFFEGALVIENIGVIDPIDGLEENMSVVIKEGRILDIFKKNEISISKKK
jgi:hypothetical protein